MGEDMKQLLLPKVGREGVTDSDNLDGAVEQEMPMWSLNGVYFVHEGARMLLLRFMTAYFTRLGLDTRAVGLLQVLGTLSAFAGELTWAHVSDKFYGFRMTAVCCNLFGVMFFMTIPFVSNYVTLCVVYSLASFGLNWVGIRDAFAVATLQATSTSVEAGASKFGRVRKFAALGWGACGLLTGALDDAFGIKGVFGLFFVMELVLMLLVFVFAHGSSQKPNDVTLQPESNRDLADIQEGSGLKSVLLKKHTMVFFANVFVYGVFTALQEVYEFVYLLKGFKGANSLLLGTTLVVMTLSELPVFHYANKLINAGFVSVYTACQLTMALRCMLYSFLPATMPWLVLAIEPFHGATFAAMWATSVEYARREAPHGYTSRLQALVSGTYFQVSQACGSLFWGFVISAIGFRPSYQVCAVALLIWSFLWNLAVRCLGDSPLSRQPRNTTICEPCLPRSANRKVVRRVRTGMFYAQMAPGFKRVRMPSLPDFNSITPIRSISSFSTLFDSAQAEPTQSPSNTPSVSEDGDVVC
eukprot:TRINITY_DN3038_c0_g1_i2.p1 TRINITY_DN3038_c0_g1~~TRINITY_DN3038_c0_g1_i2.p1  ORF type:complete len:527 (+),score=69.35 TRINITY_DN3038_c0_g1_i2:56-1636(+)